MLQLQRLGLSERQALKLMGISPSTLRYRPCGYCNAALLKLLKELAGQLRRHGYQMLHSRLRIDGWGETKETDEDVKERTREASALRQREAVQRGGSTKRVL